MNVPHLWLLDDLDAVHVVLHGVDDDEDVSKLGGDDASPVVSRVLRPHNMHFVITQVPQLQTQEGAVSHRKWMEYIFRNQSDL